MLSFIGTGSGFNPELGNTSAYMKNNQTLLLIDCGGTVFDNIYNRNLLDGIRNLYILITHTHGDHIGSLSDLAAYSYLVKGISPVIIYPKGLEIKKYLDITIGQVLYQLNPIPLNTTIFLEHDLCQSVIMAIETTHSPSLNLCVGYYIEHNGKRIYYSGDANNIPNKMLNKLCHGELDTLYQDVNSKNDDKADHLYIGKLEEMIKPQMRSKIVCMHLDQNINLNELEEKGFKYAVQYSKELSHN